MKEVVKEENWANGAQEKSTNYENIISMDIFHLGDTHEPEAPYTIRINPQLMEKFLVEELGMKQREKIVLYIIGENGNPPPILKGLEDPKAFGVFSASRDLQGRTSMGVNIKNVWAKAKTLRDELTTFFINKKVPPTREELPPFLTSFLLKYDASELFISAKRLIPYLQTAPPERAEEFLRNLIKKATTRLVKELFIHESIHAAKHSKDKLLVVKEIATMVVTPIVVETIIFLINPLLMPLALGLAAGLGFGGVHIFGELPVRRKGKMYNRKPEWSEIIDFSLNTNL
jgi:hypothetical protein